jgi:hypothetical protein
LFPAAPAGQPGAAAAGGETGSISGFVFRDDDGDGVRDPGEPGLQRLVQLVQEDELIDEDLSDGNGAYSFAGISPGEYELITEFDGGAFFCLEPTFPNFSPFALSGCSGILEQPWEATTPESTAAEITPGLNLVVDFGGRPVDQNVFIGRAIIEDQYAAPGTRVEAFVNDRPCGEGVVEPQSGFDGNPPVHRTVVMGSLEREGCAVAGDTVRFRIDGQPALETSIFTDQINILAGPGRFIVHLSAMEQTAWYWAQQPGGALPAHGTVLEAANLGEICGGVLVESRPDLSAQQISGFSRLIVRAAEAPSGCATPGSVVEFIANGVAWGTTVWRPGIEKINLAMEPPTPSTPEPMAPTPSTLPHTGARPAVVSQPSPYREVGAFASVAGLALLATTMCAASWLRRGDELGTVVQLN